MLFAIILRPYSQAPGDEDSRYTDDEDAPIYPDNEKTLMDSYHYSYLAISLEILYQEQSGMIGWNDDEMNTIIPTYGWQYSVCISVYFMYSEYHSCVETYSYWRHMICSVKVTQTN